MFLLKCRMCNNKKSRFIKELKANGLLSQLGIKTPERKIPLLGNTCHNDLRFS